MTQLELGLFGDHPSPVVREDGRPASSVQSHTTPLPPADELQTMARHWVRRLGVEKLADELRVEWSARLKSTAGLAYPTLHLVRLNPRLVEFPGEIERTLKHELAHLVAHARAGHKRIASHGPEWQEACRELGLHDETACHRLPLPRARRPRPYRYHCPRCGRVYERCQPFRRATACGECCRRYASNRFHPDFRLVPLPKNMPYSPHPES